MKRLSEIEGLRGYLAAWVLVAHALLAAGYGYAELSGGMQILRTGPFAVDVFIIISGFVIFYLLDSRPETYQIFILRRFFRLWPLFMLLFVVAIPVSELRADAVGLSQHLISAEEAADYLRRVENWWKNLPTHVALHAVMLHGLVPNVVLFDAPGAFLVAAWSISLEWQFYLLAPLLFRLAMSGPRQRGIWLLSLGCLVVFLLTPRLPKVEYGAFLPQHIEYFLIGMLSYLGYRWFHELQLRSSLLPIAIALALVVYFTGGNKKLLPICLWLMFYALILDLPTASATSLAVRLAWFFNNAFNQWVGKVSYSLYLCHGMILNVIKYYCLIWWPSMEGPALLACLLIAGLPLSLLASGLLYRFIEKPGIEVGQRLVAKLKNRSTD